MREQAQIAIDSADCIIFVTDVRTGMVALERGQFTIDEQTKVKGEYDYGKNVL